jgi:predicted NBD/HSP70 family sugar kinase
VPSKKPMNIIGIDTGATFTRLWDGRNKVVKVQTPREYESYLNLITSLLNTYSSIHNLVIALPAVIENYQIVKAPNLGKSWGKKNVKFDLSKLPSLTGDIAIIQDTAAAARGIQVYEKINVQPTIVITLSSGVGGALIVDDLIMPLEAGHMILDLSGCNLECGCGQRGCVEADLSGTAIYKNFSVRAEEMTDQNFWESYGIKLGQFLSVLVPLFKLKQVILMGSITNKSEHFLTQTNLYLQTKIKSLALPKISISTLGDNAGVYGAHWIGSNKMRA